MKTSRRAIPLDAPKLAQWASQLVEKALAVLEQDILEAKGRGLKDAENRPILQRELAEETLEVVNVRKQTFKVDVEIASRMGRSSMPTAGGHYIENWKTIQLFINGKWSLNQLRMEQHELAKSIGSMLLHEVTHAMDELAEDLQPLHGDSGAAYYNQPHEVRAYGRQIVDEVLKAYKAKLLMERRRPGSMPKGHRLIEDLLDSSRTWVDMGQFLNPKNKRLIRQMVVRELQDAHPDRELSARVVARFKSG